jgi:hypothetical protein
METVLVCLSPSASIQDYEFFEAQFKGKGWEPYVVDADAAGEADTTRIAAVVAHATDWPEAELAGRLRRIREAVGPRKRLLAILPRPPDQYPAETQQLWSQALGYGFKISEAVAIVDDFIAGRR